MKLISIPDLAGKVKGKWTEFVRGLILACYIGVLYWMASNNWQVYNFILFICILAGLPFLVVMLFKILQKGEG